MDHNAVADGGVPRTRIPLAILLLVGGFLLVIGGGWYILKSTQQNMPLQSASALADYGSVPDISLVERSGKTMSLGELKGDIWVASFIFTRCGGSCPAMSMKMKDLQESLSKAGGARLVSFTVDPDNDTPERLAEYAKTYQADQNKWLFMTGSRQQMQDLAKNSFHLAIEEGTDPKEPIIHSKRFILIDQEGTIRGYYDSEDAEAKQKLLGDIGTLLRGDGR